MAKRSEKEIRKEQIGDVQAVLQMVGGRRFLHRLIEDVCGVHKPIFRMPHPDSGVMPEERLAVNGAKQAIGNWLREELKAIDLSRFDLMYLEAETQKAIDAQMADTKKALEKGGEETNDGE